MTTIPSLILALIIAAESMPIHGMSPAALSDANAYLHTTYTLADVAADRAIAHACMRGYLSRWCTRERLGYEPDTLAYMATYRAGPNAAFRKWDFFHYFLQGQRNLLAFRLDADAPK